MLSMISLKLFLNMISYDKIPQSPKFSEKTPFPYVWMMEPFIACNV